jgi:hypothetical protein
MYLPCKDAGCAVRDCSELPGVGRCRDWFRRASYRGRIGHRHTQHIVATVFIGPSHKKIKFFGILCRILLVGICLPFQY